MPRVKGGYTTRRRRKAILKLAKGYFGSKRTLYKTAHEQVMRSLAYSYRDRKQKKREFRKLWIARINAACKANDYKYSLLALVSCQQTTAVVEVISRADRPIGGKQVATVRKVATFQVLVAHAGCT